MNRKKDERSHAKLFANGHSQAVRLPKAFRFEGREVKVSRVGKSVVLTPVLHDLRYLYAALQQFSPEFTSALRELRDSIDREAHPAFASQTTRE